MIFGVGIDTIEVPRIARLLSRDDRFRNRVFTEGEIAYCEGKRYRAQFYAARFAAKEAFLKALGTGLRGGVRWTDVEVAHDSTGRPVIRLSGRAKEIAKTNDISRIHLSLSHIRELASAIVITEKQRGGEAEKQISEKGIGKGREEER